MRKFRLALVLYCTLDFLIGYAGLFPGFHTATAQQVPANPITTQQINMPVFTAVPVPVTNATIAISGNPGRQAIYYWIAANFAVGNANLAGPFPILNAPNPLSASNFVTIDPVMPAGATTYDVLKTLTPTMPSGACACAVATAVAIGTVTNDQSNSTGAYTVTTATINNLAFMLRNEVQGSGSSHLILRQNGNFVSDLSLSGTASPAGVNTQLQLNNAGVFGGANYFDNGTEQFIKSDSGNNFNLYFNGNSSIFALNRDPSTGTIGFASDAAVNLLAISSTQYRFDIYSGAGAFLSSPLSLTGNGAGSPNLNKTVYVDGVTNTTIAASITALGSSDGTIVVPAGSYTLSSSTTVGSTTQQVQLTIQRGAVVNITETDAGTAIKLGKYSKLYCEQGGTINVASTAILLDVVANLTQDSTQEAAYVEGCYFNITSGASVTGAVIHFKRLFVNSSIRHVIIVSPPHYGWWIESGTGGGLGSSENSVDDTWVTAGTAISGSVACAITGGNGAGEISVSKGACEHSGLYNIYIDGLGGANLAAAENITFTGVGTESVTGQTGPYIYIRDAHDITIQSTQATGTVSADVVQLSQSAAGLTHDIHLRQIYGNIAGENLVNNTINSTTIPTTAAQFGLSSYDFLTPQYLDQTVTTGSGFQFPGNKQFVAADFTLAANTNLQTFLSWTFPANKALNASFHCSLNYSQATAAVSIAFGVQGATVAPTNINANGTVYTSTTAATTGTLNGLSTTTATVIVSATPSAIATIFKAELDGTVEEPSNASQPVINIMASTTNASDLVTIKRGSYCTLY